METTVRNGKVIALISGTEAIITDAQSALDLLMRAKYDAGTDLLVVEKSAITEDFFVLSTGLAGEVLQKFINYNGKIAIYGDFSGYTSKPLHDFIYESNQGKDVFFASTQEEAIDRLAQIHEHTSMADGWNGVIEES